MSKRKVTPNTLPIVTRKDGTIDVAENKWGITSVEAEFDRAMKSQADYSRAHPVEHAVGELTHWWKHNRFGMTTYGDMLEFFMKQPEWEKVKPLVEAKGLPVTMEAWKVALANHTWKLRHQWIREGRGLQHYVKQPWYATYQMLVNINHPVLKGEWAGDLT